MATKTGKDKVVKIQEALEEEHRIRQAFKDKKLVRDQELRLVGDL